jgi:hypothetical protein
MNYEVINWMRELADKKTPIIVFNTPIKPIQEAKKLKGEKAKIVSATKSSAPSRKNWSKSKSWKGSETKTTKSIQYS